MTSDLRNRTPLHAHLESVSRALGLTHLQRSQGCGYQDHMLIGPEDDVRDAGRAVKRLGFGYALCPAPFGTQYMLIIKYVWTPGDRT